MTGPALLGRATDVIVRGVFGQDLAGTAPGPASTSVSSDASCLIVLAVYLCGWAFGVLQARLTTALVQRTVYRLRQQ